MLKKAEKKESADRCLYREEGWGVEKRSGLHKWKGFDS